VSATGYDTFDDQDGVGAMISAKVLRDQRPRAFWSQPWVLTLLFAIVSVIVLGLWAAGALVAGGAVLRLRDA